MIDVTLWDYLLVVLDIYDLEINVEECDYKYEDVINCIRYNHI